MINNIQALRAFAALNVVLFHALSVGSSYGYKSEFLSALDGWSANGVDIFFVISGFVMIYSQTINPRSFIYFMKNRIKRIVPLYFSISLFFVLLLYFFPFAFRQATFDLKHSISSFLFASQALGFEYPVIIPGWTLEYEMFFYLIFGISIFTHRANSIFVVSIFFLAFTLLTDIKPVIFEFALGMLVGFVYLKGYLKRYGLLFLLIGSFLLLASIYIKTDLNRVFIWGIPSFFLVLGCCYLPQINNRFFIFLGEASFSIYIIHVVTMPAFFRIIKFSGIFEAGVGSYLPIILCLIFSAFSGVFLFHFYEKPIAVYLK